MNSISLLKKSMELEILQQYLRDFARERNWDRFHNPKNLVMALAGETGELLEIFQWLTTEESTAEKLGPVNYTATKDELADIFIYLIRISDLLGIDLVEAFYEKMEKNAEKYPPGKNVGDNFTFNR